MQRRNVWHNAEMLEHAPINEGKPGYAPHAETQASKFFDYAEAHRDDGVESSMTTTQVLLDALHDSEGTFFEDIGSMYPLIKERVLVRRENVETVMHNLLDNEDINIDPKGLYPNVAWWDIAHGSEGLKNAFLEGRAQLNGVVAVVGFEPSGMLAVVDQKDIPDEPGVFKGSDGAELDRRFVASAHGTVSHDDIRFVIFRFPYQHFPEVKMADSEIEGGEKNPSGKLQYIFRGVYFPKDTARTTH